MAKKQIMGDIETLATSNDAVIIQIAMSRFDIPTGKLVGDPFEVRITTKSCLEFGMAKDPRTVAWWKSQDPAVMASVTREPRVTITEGLTALKEWYPKDGILWSHRFDTAILRDAFKRVLGQNEAPWHYTAERDLRTLLSIFSVGGRTVPIELWQNDEKHNAVADVKVQSRVAAYQLREILGIKHPDA